MLEIDRLKKEIAYISERNVKLVELYVEGETKDLWRSVHMIPVEKKIFLYSILIFYYP